MEPSAAHQNFQKFKLAAKRPDSMKLELLTIPENNYVNSFGTSNSVVNVSFKNITYAVKEGIIKRSKYD